MPRIAIARRHLRPQLLAGRHAARAAVHPVEVNTTMKSTMRVSARGKINSVVSDRSGPPHRGWLRFRSESLSLSFNGKAPLVTASRTSSRVFVGARGLCRDGAASTGMGIWARRRAEKLQARVRGSCVVERCDQRALAARVAAHELGLLAAQIRVRVGAFPHHAEMRCNQASEYRGLSSCSRRG